MKEFDLWLLVLVAVSALLFWLGRKDKDPFPATALLTLIFWIGYGCAASVRIVWLMLVPWFA